MAEWSQYESPPPMKDTGRSLREMVQEEMAKARIISRRSQRERDDNLRRPSARESSQIQRARS
jgi:hypothetical protein